MPAGEIRTSKSTLTHASGRRATYGEMAVAASRQTPPDNPPLKTAAQFTFIGKDRSTPRVDSPSKCNGTAIYTIDVKLPGLLTAVIAWPPGLRRQARVLRCHRREEGEGRHRRRRSARRRGRRRHGHVGRAAGQARAQGAMGRVGEQGPRFGRAAGPLSRAGRAAGHAVHQADDDIRCACAGQRRSRRCTSFRSLPTRRWSR